MSESDIPTIAKAEPADAAAIRGIALAANIDAWPEADYRAEILRPDSYVLKAALSGSVSGFLLARMVPGKGEYPDIDLYNIAVSPARLRMGFGSALMAELLSRLRTTGVGNIWLEVRESNAAAIRFYEKHGFLAELSRPNFYGNPVENAVIMRLKLTSYRQS